MLPHFQEAFVSPKIISDVNWNLISGFGFKGFYEYQFVRSGKKSQFIFLKFAGISTLQKGAFAFPAINYFRKDSRLPVGCHYFQSPFENP